MTQPTQPDLSIIFGTYNRRRYLEDAVLSIRNSVGQATYEIIVCDGGSSDGSREWLASQSDVVLVGKRSLDGAVDAFNHAARLARGRYLCNFNDDAVYVLDALYQAVSYMDRHPEVGQGAFELNVGNPERWTHQVAVGEFVYANFGIVRRELAEDISYIQGGFWSPAYFTYGADCEFSLWVYKLGWKVGAIPARVRDTAAFDDLRKHNEKDGRHHKDGEAYRKRWGDPRRVHPLGPDPDVDPTVLERFQIMARKQTSAPATAHWEANPYWLLHEHDPVPGRLPPTYAQLATERVFHIKIQTDDDPQRSVTDALALHGAYEMYNWFEELNVKKHPVDTIRRDILARVEAFKPSMIFMQLQNAEILDALTVRSLRGRARNHKLVTMAWTGDVSRPNSVHPDDVRWQKELYQHMDLALFTSVDQVKAMRAAGLPHAAYLQIGYDTDRYWFHDDGWAKRSGMCFIANVHGFVDCGVPEIGVDTRIGAVKALIGRGFPVACYGHGWGVLGNSMNYGPLPQVKSGDVYRSHIGALNISNANGLERYSSDRLFRALACGPVVFTKRFPDLEGLGLKHGENCIVWDDVQEIIDITRDATRDGKGERLRAIGREGAKLARDYHTWQRRMHELAPLVHAVRRIKRVA